MPPDSAPSGRGSTASPVISKRFDGLTAAELHAILRLRSDVFVVEQNCAYGDIDGLDEAAGTTHHWIVVDGVLASYARVVRDRNATRIGRVVTNGAYRGAGLATRIVSHIRDSSSGLLTLESQAHLVDWYQKLGFDATGPEYVEDGIPHVPMKRP